MSSRAAGRPRCAKGAQATVPDLERLQVGFQWGSRQLHAVTQEVAQLQGVQVGEEALTATAGGRGTQGLRGWHGRSPEDRLQPPDAPWFVPAESCWDRCPQSRRLFSVLCL